MMRYLLLRLAMLLPVATLSYAAAQALPAANAAEPTRPVRAPVIAEQLASVPRDERIVLNATQPLRHRITVFTDIDCPYCRKLHQQIEQYRQAGIEVQYLFYPRAGRDSPAYAKAVAVWCAEDRIAALALAFDAHTFPPGTCQNPIAEHYGLAIRIGLLGTPALVTESGDVMYGVVPVARLLNRLEAPDDMRTTLSH